MKREININIDLYKKNTLTYLLKKGDTTTLIFTIIADNKSFDLTGKTFQLNLLKNNNKLNIITNKDSFTILENVITVSLNPEALNVAGDGELELILMQGVDKLSSFFVKIKIEADMLDIQEDSENYIDLQNDIQEVIDTINTAKNDIGTVIQEVINTNMGAIETQINDITNTAKTDLNVVVDNANIVKNDLNEAIISAGDITGNIAEINTSITTASNTNSTLNTSITNANGAITTIDNKIIEAGTATETLTAKITEAENIEITAPVIDYTELDTKYLKKDQTSLNLLKYNVYGSDYSVRIKQDGTSRGFVLDIVKPDGTDYGIHLAIGESTISYNGVSIVTYKTLIPAITAYLNDSSYRPTLGIYAFGGSINTYNVDNKIIPTLLNTTDTEVFGTSSLIDKSVSGGVFEYYNATLNLTIDSVSPVKGTVKLIMMDVNGNIDNTNILNTYTNTKIIDTAINGTELILSKFMQNNNIYKYLGIVVNLTTTTPVTISGTLSMYQMRS